MRRRLHELVSAARPGGGADGAEGMPPEGEPFEGESGGSDLPPRGRGGAGRRRPGPVAAGSGREGSADAGSGRAPRGGDPRGGTVEQAKEACLRLLAVRARSRAELTQRLAAKGFDAEVTASALDRLAEVGLIDDAAFAEQWVHSRHTFSGKGRAALAQELRRKGVAPETAAAALDGISADDEHERAAELVRRKLRTLPASIDRDAALRRLAGMLARRGYPSSVAFPVVRAELERAGIGSATDLVDPDL